MVEQMSLLDHDTWFGKTYPEHSQATVEKTSKPSSRKSCGSSSRMQPMFLYLTKESGQKPDALWVTERTESRFPLPTDFRMPSFGELPSEENVSVLSQILEEQAHPRYSLSVKACEGILRRADKRGKGLPDVLREALENQIRNGTYSEN